MHSDKLGSCAVTFSKLKFPHLKYISNRFDVFKQIVNKFITALTYSGLA